MSVDPSRASCIRCHGKNPDCGSCLPEDFREGEMTRAEAARIAESLIVDLADALAPPGTPPAPGPDPDQLRALASFGAKLGPGDRPIIVIAIGEDSRARVISSIKGSMSTTAGVLRACAGEVETALGIAADPPDDPHDDPLDDDDDDGFLDDDPLDDDERDDENAPDELGEPIEAGRQSSLETMARWTTELRRLDLFPLAVIGVDSLNRVTLRGVLSRGDPEPMQLAMLLVAAAAAVAEAAPRGESEDPYALDKLARGVNEIHIRLIEASLGR